MFCIYLWQIFYANRLILSGNEGAHRNLLYSITFNQRLDFYGIDQSVLVDHSYYNAKAYSNKPPGYPFLIVPFYYLYSKIASPHPYLRYHRTLTALKIASALFSALTIGIIFLFYCTYDISKNSIISPHFPLAPHDAFRCGKSGEMILFLGEQSLATDAT